jgi:hypothetical protein
MIMPERKVAYTGSHTGSAILPLLHIGPDINFPSEAGPMLGV